MAQSGVGSWLLMARQEFSHTIWWKRMRNCTKNQSRMDCDSHLRELFRATCLSPRKFDQICLLSSKSPLRFFCLNLKFVYSHLWVLQLPRDFKGLRCVVCWRNALCESTSGWTASFLYLGSDVSKARLNAPEFRASTGEMSWKDLKFPIEPEATCKWLDIFFQNTVSMSRYAGFESPLRQKQPFRSCFWCCSVASKQNIFWICCDRFLPAASNQKYSDTCFLWLQGVSPQVNQWKELRLDSSPVN